MTGKIKVAAVSYLNTKPFLHGIERSAVRGEMLLSLEQPSVIAKRLLADEIDLGLVPVSVVPQLKESHIVSDFGICCDGEVASVVICSQMKLRESEKLFLDYQSRTSSALAQILLKEFWKASPRVVAGSPGYEKQVMGKYAGLFIGDRALKLKEMYDHVYDLGDAWKQWTGMPFVFACWVANKNIDQQFLQLFNEALAYGVDHREKVIAEYQPLYPQVDIADYLWNKIQFSLDDEKKKAMNYFLELVAKQERVAF